MINFLKGMFIGLAMAAPVGPLAILCIRRSLAKGYAEGLATASGVALVDGFYALVAALGLTAISSFVLERREYLFMGGGLMLMMLGIRALKNPPQLKNDVVKHRGFFTTLIQTMLITLTNPMTIITFIAAFTAVGFEDLQADISQAIIIAFGVFLGSMSWFMFISFSAAYFRKHLTPYMLWLLNTLSGIILLGFGLLFLIDAAYELLVKVYT